MSEDDWWRNSTPQMRQAVEAWREDNKMSDWLRAQNEIATLQQRVATLEAENQTLRRSIMNMAPETESAPAEAEVSS